MIRSVRVRKWAGTSAIVAVVSALIVASPLLEHPVCAQQTWTPPPQQGWAPPPTGAPGYPPPAYAPPFDAGRAVAQATQDAQADESGGLWFFAGCLLGIIGVIVAYVAEPVPPPARLMGKSPEYVAIYTQTYKDQGRSAQLRSALWGMGTTLVVVVAIYVIVIVAIVKSQPMTTY
ncbi:MAG TPA: hypothetical protein VHO06_13390 [Polyangia bacterium]|nr:hypothetical protein [Polyangia bacterium]